MDENVSTPYDEDVVWKRMIYHGQDLGDYYLVSNTGEIKGVKTGKIRKKNINHEGYYFVGVSIGSRENKPCIKVHRAVAETFLINENNYPVINHKDGNKLNNNINNLEFCTFSYNTQHAIKNGLRELMGIDNSKRIRCIETNMIFDSIEKAALWCNRTAKTISDYLGCKKEIRKSAGKHPETGVPLHWEYYIEDEK